MNHFEWLMTTTTRRWCRRRRLLCWQTFTRKIKQPHRRLAMKVPQAVQQQPQLLQHLRNTPSNKCLFAQLSSCWFSAYAPSFTAVGTFVYFFLRGKTKFTFSLRSNIGRPVEASDERNISGFGFVRDNRNVFGHWNLYFLHDRTKVKNEILIYEISF